MRRQLDRAGLARLLQAEDVTQLAFPRLLDLFREERGIADFVPDGLCQIDPRDGQRILFNSARARRPHDNRPSQEIRAPDRPCVVCQGRTTGVIDVAELSEGFTFINKNLYPALYPLEGPLTLNPGGAARFFTTSGGTEPSYSDSREAGSPPASSGDPRGVAPQARPEQRRSVGGPPGLPSYGLHLLQWTSSLHDRDWHNMPLADRVIVMQRLAALEKRLLTGARKILPATETWDDGTDRHGAVLIIKNYGRLVGGSLVHGHQQIAFSNVVPRRLRDDLRFFQAHGETFAGYMLRENPAPLLVRDYGEAVLLVPYFMRRPYDMMLVLKDTRRQNLHDLSEPEIAAVAEGWHDAIRAIRVVMTETGRELAYNVVTHNGPGNGLYFEFLPYMQETGGFEHLGLWICQGNPERAAAQLRQHLSHPSPESGRVRDGNAW